MHTRMKSQLTKYNSKKQDIRDSSTFYKDIKNSHGGAFQGKRFEEFFEVKLVKAYSKPATMQTEEGIFMINLKGELLNKKNEWHQPKLIRTTIHTEGAEMAGGQWGLDSILPSGWSPRTSPTGQSLRTSPSGWRPRSPDRWRQGNSD